MAMPCSSNRQALPKIQRFCAEKTFETPTVSAHLVIIGRDGKILSNTLAVPLPLGDAHQGRVFLCADLPMTAPFTKPWISVEQQLDRLKNAGLTIGDEKVAAAFLQHLNYYRFRGYCVAFMSGNQFRECGTFEDIRHAYQFDWRLRDLLTEALELIEVDFRSAIAAHFGKTYDAFGHTDATNFYPRFKHADWHSQSKTETERSKEMFVEHFRATYSDFPDLPIWMLTEVLSFGMLSRMLKGMNRCDQNAIADRYGRRSTFLASWFHHASYIRNMCAHHSRVWDRKWTIKPKMAPIPKWQYPHLPDNAHLFVTLLILRILLRHIPAVAEFAIDWKLRVEELLGDPPRTNHPIEQMGLTPDWETHPDWV